VERSTPLVITLKMQLLTDAGESIILPSTLQPAYILPAANIYVVLMTHSACQTEGVDLT
jgi:hypothetical protein